MSIIESPSQEYFHDLFFEVFMILLFCMYLYFINGGAHWLKSSSMI